MRLNWLAYNYKTTDGYGRYSAYMVRALRRAGVEVTANFIGAPFAPAWLRDEWRIDNSAPTIICAPPYFLQGKTAGSAPHWLLSMTEGSELPDGWAEYINRTGIERVIVPCEHNAKVFRRGGVRCPVSVVPGGTDPDEFPVRPHKPSRPYTFLCLADRGLRKGYNEVYLAFYIAFGGKTTGDMDVRLIIKSHPDNEDVARLARAGDLDKRIIVDMQDYDNIADLYAQADCFAIPSRCEGWGMPHREAAMMGVPVITQCYSGMDDGHTYEWASVVRGGRLEKVDGDKHIKGQWRTVDRDELADVMRQHYEHPDVFAQVGQAAARWLRQHQTWDDAVLQLIGLLQQTGVFMPERVYA